MFVVGIQILLDHAEVITTTIHIIFEGCHYVVVDAESRGPIVGRGNIMMIWYRLRHKNMGERDCYASALVPNERRGVSTDLP